MLSSNNNVESLSALLKDLKSYFTLRSELFQLTFVEKLTLLVSSLVLFLLLLALSVLVLVFISIGLVLFIAPYIGSLGLAFFVVALLYLIVGAILYIKRRSLIINPIAHLLYTYVSDLHTKVKGSDKTL